MRKFVALVNDPRTGELNGLLQEIAADLSEQGASGIQPTGDAAAYLRLAELRAQALARHAESTDDELTLEMSGVVTFYFLANWHGWRVLQRCLTCRSYFIAEDDRQVYCQASCRESRSPLSTVARVRRHRASKR